MKEIKLTQGQVTLVDDSDFELLNQWKWCVNWAPVAESFYAVRREKSSRIQMARVIMNCPKDKIVDHINHNTLDNQKRNLRVCTYSENGRNSCSYVGTSKYKGVSWDKGSRKWRAAIGLRDVFNQSYKKCLGYFKDEEDAARAYDKAAKEEFEEFTYFNFSENRG